MDFRDTDRERGGGRGGGGRGGGAQNPTFMVLLKGSVRDFRLYKGWGAGES